MAYNGYSAKVVLQLVVGGVTLSLSHVGSSGFIVRDACQPIPAGEADIVITVDDSRSVRKVFLPHGIPGPGQPIAFF